MDVSAQDKFKQTYTGVYVSVISGSRCRQPFVIPFAFVLACLEEAAGLGVCVCGLWSPEGRNVVLYRLLLSFRDPTGLGLWLSVTMVATWCEESRHLSLQGACGSVSSTTISEHGVMRRSFQLQSRSVNEPTNQ